MYGILSRSRCFVLMKKAARFFSVLVQKIVTLVLILTFTFTDISSILRFSFIPEIPTAEAAIDTENAIKIEVFDQDVTTNGSTFALTTPVAATSSAFLRITTGTRKSSAGPVGSTADTAPDVGTVGLVLSSTSTVTAYRASSTAVKVMGEVWRYEGPAGGGNEFIVRDRVAITFAGSSQSVPIPGITNVNKVIPFVTGYTLDAPATTDWNEATIAARMDTSGNLYVSRNNAGATTTVYVDVVEFTGSNWKVCYGLSAAHDTTPETVTLNTEVDGVSGAVCDVTDWNTATIIEATMEGDSAETGLSDTLALVEPGSNTTSVVFDILQDVNARNDGNAWIYVLQNPDLTVNRASNADFPEGNGTYENAPWPTGASTTTSLDLLGLEWFTDTSGVGTAHMRGGLHAKINDGLIRYADGDQVTSDQYDSTVQGNFTSTLTFDPSPSGVIYEAGGTGTGAFVGYNDAGDFIIRAGNGGSVSPPDAARIVIPPSEYDFSGRSGTLTWNFYPATDSVDLSFDEGSDGLIDYATSTTASSSWANWSGGNLGYVGNSNGNIAGSEITSNYDFNGVINEVVFSQTQFVPVVRNWIHRNGNTVGLTYGVIDLSALKAITTDVFVTATGTYRVDADIPKTNVYAGGTFVIQENTSSRNITSITLTESGTVDASLGLNNIKLFYDLDTTAPYDCSSEVYDGTEAQYGSTDTNGFSGSDGVSSFSDSVTISTTQAMCVYAVYDTTDAAKDGDTVKLSINNPSVDVVGSNSATVGPSSVVASASSTLLRNAELTLTHYRWLDDDGGEGSATALEAEDTPTGGFANGVIRRVRFQVDAAGSTSSLPTTFQIDYATKTAACNTLTSWEQVGAAGSVWLMADSSFFTDGDDSTNIAESSGGITDPLDALNYLSPNGSLRDLSSQTGPLTLARDDFLEFEYAIEPTTAAPEGNTYCFRLSNGGTPLRNYSQFAEGTISAEVTVSATGTQVASVDLNTTAQYIGGTFVIEGPTAARTLNDIVVTETGTVDAQANLSNPTLYYDLDTTAPYDCAGEFYDGSEASVGGTAFTAANGSTTFSGIGETLRNTQTFCGYLVVDVGVNALNGETINFEISNPSRDVLVTNSSVGPSTVVSPTGSTTINGPILTQTGFHWRNDDGTETGASSATNGNENTVISDIAKGSTQRLRLQVSNEGTVVSQQTAYRLEYGTKITTCGDISSWVDVGAIGGAFDMIDTININDGDDTTDIAVSIGGITNANTTFLAQNGGQKDISSETAGLVLSGTEFVEFEYAITPTADAGDDTTYCFRLTDAGAPLLQYDQYPELTTRAKQDFFVQRGYNDVTGTGLTLYAGTDYTAPASSSLAFVRITNSQLTGAGDTSAGGTQNADDVTAYISDQSNLQASFTIARPATAASSTRVNWEIVEYIGLNGADNEMKVRSVGTVTFDPNSLYATGTPVTGVIDDNDVVVFITGQLNPNTGTANYNDGLATAAWDPVNSVPVFTRADADNVAAGISYAVVEYTGANWKVQRVEHTYTATGTAETESISPVTSLSSTFLHVQKRVGDALAGLDEYGQQVWLSSIGAVSFQLQSTADNPSGQVAVVWVIENTQTGNGAMNVYRSNGTVASGGPEPESNILSIGATIRPSNASIFVNNDSTGTGTAYPRPILGVRITSPTEYELWNSDTGQNQAYRTEVIEWPVAEMSIRQNYYRFYVDNDALDPTDPWPVGVKDLGENTAITGADQPLGDGEWFRLRMSLLVNNASLPAATESFKLQFGRRSTVCSAITTWTDLGDPGGGEIWRGYSANPADGTPLATSTPATGTLNLSVSDVAGTYEDANLTALNPYKVNIGEDIEYDWNVEHNGAAQLSDYCFRMVKSDGTELDEYYNYPTVRTTGYTPVVSRWRWYDDATSTTPTSPLAAENETPTNLNNENEVKLRVTVAEVEGAAGTNIKFALQFSEYADFSDGGTYVVSTSSCTANSLWCYVDGAGIDNATITTTVLSDADSCVSGVGDGCGTYNEAATTTSTFDQASLTTAEMEFTLKSAGPRVGAVYYFRLYDVTNDVPVAASSSYPSVVAGNSQTTFGISGLNAGTAIGSTVVTDATTTATAVTFQTLPFDSPYEAAQRLSIDTNSTEGYQVLVYQDQDLTNAYGTTIPPITGTNASPLSWAQGCDANATGCFGYHTTDSILEGGSTRFGAEDTYAAFSATPEEVMYSSVPTAESHDMVYKIQVGQSQPAGEYQNSITYLVIPVF